jgi:hypothetical protein
VACFDAGSVIAGIGQIVRPDLKVADSASLWLLVQGLIALLEFLVFVLAIVFFLVWLNRAYKNLYALRPQHLEFSSGWAVGWWFIPFANLVKPFQVVREVWAESDPEITEGSTFLSMSLHQAPTYMGLWWASWIIMNISSNIASRTLDVEDPSSIAFSGYVFVFAGIIGVLSAVLAIMVIRDITSRQELRSTRINALFASQSPPPPPTFHDHDQS